MPSAPSSDVKFEIGHVLFIDIVGYSKLLINQQSEQLETLKKIVRGTEQFRLVEAERQTPAPAYRGRRRAGVSKYSGSTGPVRSRDQQIVRDIRGAYQSSRQPAR